MFPTPSLHSVPPSSRPSMLGTGTAGMPSEANLSRLRCRLRQSGAIMSSRSVASRADAQMDFEVVDVGEGSHPTGVEQLLARLEQHGLRRRLAAEDDASAYAVDVAVRAEEEGQEAPQQQHRKGSPASEANEEDTPFASDEHRSGVAAVSRSASGSRHGDADADARAPYYYLCVPCELRLTRISRHAPPWRALEDVHFHFSSAAHRSTASWMADDDIDETLHCTPLVTPTSHYSRVFLNGVPTLLSRRPGGGDMFYPLPHEVDAVRPPPRGHDGAAGYESNVPSRASSMGRSGGGEDGAGQPFQLFPSASARGESGGQAVFWQRPLPSVYTKAVQLPRREAQPPPPVKKDHRGRAEQASIYRLRRQAARAQVYVDHVDLQTYRAHTRLPPPLLPLTPAVLPVHRTRIAKALLRLEGAPARNSGIEGAVHAIHADDPHRTVYTQSYIPLAEGWRDVERQGGGEAITEPPVPLVVFEDENYRVALVSAEEQQRRLVRRPSRPPRGASQDGEGRAMLTRALLTQHTQTTSQSWRSPGNSVGSASLVSSMVRTPGSRRSSVPPPSRSSSDASSSHEA